MGDVRPGKCATKQLVPEDQISQLPNEILCCILSSLSLKEAGRTSVVSKRWKDVWTYIPELDFNSLTNLYEMAATDDEYRISLRRERAQFVNWVNKVLGCHQALVLNRFRIYIDLDDSYSEDMNKWLQYAFDRSVQRLEVNLSQHGPCGILNFEHCAFPSEIASQRSWNSLKVLILKRVKVSGNDLKFFLDNCKLLDTLVVHCSVALKSLEVCGPSLALQHLEIRLCPLKTLILCNVNVTSLKIDAPNALVLENVPWLVDLNFTTCPYNVKDVFCQLSCCFSKLKVLSLNLKRGRHGKVEGKLPQLSALKQLYVQLVLLQEESMLGLSSFLSASPNLEKGVIKLNYRYDKIIRMSSKRENLVNYPFQDLKVVEIKGYRGRTVELELVKYFIRNAVSLEKIIVDPHYRFRIKPEEPWYNEGKIRSLEAEIEHDGRRCAKQQLPGLVPSHVTLHIL